MRAIGSAVAVTIVCAFLGACGGSGYSFVPVPLNPGLPQDFKNRTVIKNSVDFRLNPETYIGEVISPDAAGNYTIISKPILAAASKPTSEMFKDGQVYSGQIDQGASAQGSYLAVVSGSLTAKQTADVEIVDAVHAYVPPAEYPDDQLFQLAATHSDVPRYWLAELYISTVSNTVFQDLEGSTSVTAPAFGAKGSVYQKYQQTLHDWSVAAKLIDIDAYARVHNKPSGGPGGPPNHVQVLRISPPELAAGGKERVVTIAALPPIHVTPTQPR